MSGDNPMEKKHAVPLFSSNELARGAQREWLDVGRIRVDHCLDRRGVDRRLDRPKELDLGRLLEDSKRTRLTVILVRWENIGIGHFWIDDLADVTGQTLVGCTLFRRDIATPVWVNLKPLENRTQ
jgi:hypothetical protein